MELLLVCGVFALIVAMVAGSKGRSGIAWFLYGLVLWPVALVHALLIKPNDTALVARGDARRCPACAELVKLEARKCRFCGTALDPLPQKSSSGYWPP